MRHPALPLPSETEGYVSSYVMYMWSLTSSAIYTRKNLTVAQMPLLQVIPFKTPLPVSGQENIFALSDTH